jgi:hypothetical protein
MNVPDPRHAARFGGRFFVPNEIAAAELPPSCPCAAKKRGAGSNNAASTAQAKAMSENQPRHSRAQIKKT